MLCANVLNVGQKLVARSIPKDNFRLLGSRALVSGQHLAARQPQAQAAVAGGTHRVVRQHSSMVCTAASSIGKGSFPQDPEKSKQLQQVVQQMDTFFGQKDGSAFDAAVADNVVLHEDLLIIDNGIQGREKVKKALSMYTDNYDYQHELVAAGEDIDGSSAFHFWLHKNLKPKSGEAVEPDETKASMWRYVTDDQGKVTDIYFLTQLTPEEKQHMLTDPKMGTGVKYDAMAWKGPELEPEDNRAANLLESAKQYSEIWETGNPAAADEILASNFNQISPIQGQELHGREEFKKMIKGLYSNYNRTGGTSAVAVDPKSNKSFIYWESKGTMEGGSPTGVSLYGLNMLVFDDAQLIKTCVGFRQLMPSERVKLLKKVPEKAGAMA